MVSWLSFIWIINSKGGFELQSSYELICIQDVCCSNPSVVTEICNPNKSQTRHHLSLNLSSKLNYVNLDKLILLEDDKFGYFESI